MKTSILSTTLAFALGVLANPAPAPQLSGLLGGLGGLFGSSSSSDDKYAYRAGDPLSENYDPMVPLERTPPWPSNFGGAAIARGPAPTGCAPFEIIISRGTSEPGPFGAIVGDPLLARVQKIMGADQVRGYAVQYDATLTSILAGAQDIGRRLSDQIAKCPNEKFALVGYSQGAAAMHMASIPAGASSKILAVVMYGDPTVSAGYRGYDDRLLENCACGDVVCMNMCSGEGHISYNTKGTHWHDKSAEFIASAFQGKPKAPSTGKTWSAPWLGSAV